MKSNWPFKDIQSETISIEHHSIDVTRYIQFDGSEFCRIMFPAGCRIQPSEFLFTAFASILNVVAGEFELFLDNQFFKRSKAEDWIFLSVNESNFEFRFAKRTTVLFHNFSKDLWLTIEQDCVFDVKNISCISCTHRKRPIIASGKMTPKCKQLSVEITNNVLTNSSSRLKLSSYLSDLLSAELNAPEFTQNKMTPVCFKKTDKMAIIKAACYLENNLHLEHSLSKLSRKVCLNESKLKKGFREVHNNTVFGFLREKRMEYALKRLKESDDTILDIANTVCYSNPSQFSKAFRSVYGKNPSEFRRVIQPVA